MFTQRLMTIDVPCRSAPRQLLVQATFRVAAISRGRQAVTAAEDASCQQLDHIALSLQLAHPFR